MGAQFSGPHAVRRRQAAARFAITRMGREPVHTDASAAASAEAVGLRLTRGKDQVVCGAGRYQPETPAGQELRMS